MELYGAFIFEENLRKALSAIHPSQFLFSTSSPGLASRIGLLDQDFVLLERYLEEDPDASYYEEL